MRDTKGKTLIRTGMLVFVLVALTVAFVGCSTDAPLAPSGDGFDALTKGRFLAVASDAACVAASGKRATVIQLRHGREKTQLVIPAGALETTVEICAEVELVETRDSLVRLYDFTPDGLVFLKPAKLILKAKFPKGTRLNLYWFNPDTGVWELEQTVKTGKKGKVKFDIYHFSKYAIS